jgi:hypothetical protein
MAGGWVGVGDRGKSHFRSCVPQLKRSDCIKYKTLWNIYGKIYNIFTERRSASAFGTRNKVTAIDRKRRTARETERSLEKIVS